MMKIQILILSILSTTAIFGQKIDTTQFKQFKKFLPYIINNLKETKENPNIKQLNERTIEVFKKPWKLKTLNSETHTKIINSIVENYSFKIKDYKNKWYLQFFSQINSNNEIKDIYKSNGILSNYFITSEIIKLTNKNNVSVIEENVRVKINQTTNTKFYTGSISFSVPIKEEIKNINGEIKLKLRKYEIIKFKELNKNDNNLIFNLGRVKGLKVIKIEKNRAYLYLPKKIKGIEIVATNKKNEEFAEKSTLLLSKNVFEFAMKDNLKESEITKFIDKLTLNDIKDKPHILIFETNGIIENLYVYLKYNPKEIISKIIEVKL